MSVSRVHYCISQERVAQGTEEPPAKRCRCRKFISLQEATALVKVGEASWVVIRRTRGEEEVTCRLCNGDPEIKNCAHCRGTRKEVVPYEDDVFGNDIVYTSRDPKDKAEKKKRMWLAPKTPRTPTVESKHIVKAYGDGLVRVRDGKRTLCHWMTTDKAALVARERIEEYGRLILEARAFIGPNKIPAIVDEPADNYQKAEGRTYDYGRSI